ncbi:MAG: hypothetical protein ACJATT_005552, partial [Myxococcota bacterium]
TDADDVQQVVVVPPRSPSTLSNADFSGWLRLEQVQSEGAFTLLASEWMTCTRPI